MSIVDSRIVGEVWPLVQPGKDPSEYGHVSLQPEGAFEVRSLQTFTLTYTVGRFGIDDTGTIRVLFRIVGDWGELQIADPSGENYVTATASNGAGLSIGYSRHGQSPRPRMKSLTIRVSGGYLSPGDTITIIFGDRSNGSPGWRLQTFAESHFEFKVAADVCAVGHYAPIPNTPHIAIIPGPAKKWVAVLPSLRRPGEPFRLGIKAEDIWGNPTPQASCTLHFISNIKVKGLPASVTFPKDERSQIIDGLTVNEEGTVWIRVLNEAGEQVAESNPLVIRPGNYSGYWGDLHGQSGETIGINTARQYFEFARNISFLDVTSHQANDFQVTKAFWEGLNNLTAEYQEDGRFVTFPGYEWSGNTCVGGDRNVYYKKEGQPLHRSSHSLISDRSDMDSDANDADQLFEALSDKDSVVYAHVGGRYADIIYHDPQIETAMEIHSAWGTFEWLLTDGFKRGHRCGVVCNSDDHKGRPGASYPGSSTFGAYGGLTCFLAEELARDGIFKSLRSRHHYGTTGTRLHLDVRATFEDGALLFGRDPQAYTDAQSKAVSEVMMGDIACTENEQVTLKVEVVAPAAVERVDILNGADIVKTVRGFSPDDLGQRIRVICSGAEYRGRGRNTQWKGFARFHNAHIHQWETINIWNPERLFELEDSNTLRWDIVTTGNFAGFDVWLQSEENSSLEINTNHVKCNLQLTEISMDDKVFQAGGLERCLKIYRLPDKNPHKIIKSSVKVPIKESGDNPIWVRVTTEDGSQAWSSPIFLFRKADLS